MDVEPKVPTSAPRDRIYGLWISRDAVIHMTFVMGHAARASRNAIRILEIASMENAISYGCH
jgi:hypothetical protein